MSDRAGVMVPPGCPVLPRHSPASRQRRVGQCQLWPARWPTFAGGLPTGSSVLDRGGKWPATLSAECGRLASRGGQARPPHQGNADISAAASASAAAQSRSLAAPAPPDLETPVRSMAGGARSNGLSLIISAAVAARSASRRARITSGCLARHLACFSAFVRAIGYFPSVFFLRPGEEKHLAVSGERVFSATKLPAPAGKGGSAQVFPWRHPAVERRLVCRRRGRAVRFLRLLRNPHPRRQRRQRSAFALAELQQSVIALQATIGAQPRELELVYELRQRPSRHHVPDVGSQEPVRLSRKPLRRHAVNDGGPFRRLLLG